MMKFCLSPEELASAFDRDIAGSADIYLNLPDHALLTPPPPLEFNSYSLTVSCHGRLATVRCTKATYALVAMLDQFKEVTLSSIENSIVGEQLGDSMTVEQAIHEIANAFERSELPWYIDYDAEEGWVALKPEYHR
jgi:hypothetical protein